jgi:hypothetical protein
MAHDGERMLRYFHDGASAQLPPVAITITDGNNRQPRQSRGYKLMAVSDARSGGTCVYRQNRGRQFSDRLECIVGIVEAWLKAVKSDAEADQINIHRQCSMRSAGIMDMRHDPLRSQWTG